MSPAAAAAATAACTLYVLTLWSSPTATGAKPVPPQQEMLVDNPHHYSHYISAVPAGGWGELEAPAPAARSLLSDIGDVFGLDLGLGAPATYTHAVAKRVRSRTSYQSSDMASPRVAGCEAVCALRKTRDSGDYE